MRAFTYERAAAPAAAAAVVAQTPGAKFIAGGTNLLDLMKLQIETPTHLVDVNGLKLDRIEPTQEGGLRIGALVRNTDLAAHERVRRDYGVLSRALLAGATHPLPLLLRHQHALQQTGAGLRLLGPRRDQPSARRDRLERGLHRHEPVRHGGRHAGARRDGRDGQA
jgi:FAD binding domain in molybdopterin dehydrogenase